MRWSAEKLRWILLGGALLLAGVVAALFGLANYRAGKVWQRILARNGVNLQRETDGFTLSKSDGKRTVFTVHAAKAIPHGNNRWTLHDAVLILYNKDGRTDRIYGSQFEYDQGEGVASAVGEVHMDLEAPQAVGKDARSAARPDLTFTPDDQSAADPALIHVRTSGLVYTRKLELAKTDQMTEFRYKGLTCTSRGAEFDSAGNALRLLAEVHLAGLMRNAPFTLTATHAVLDRNANTADFVQTEVVSRQRDGRANHALLHLHRDGSLETGDADGDVQLRSATAVVSAPQLHAVFGAENRPQQAMLGGGVQYVDNDAKRSTRGTANTVNFHMNATGAVETALAQGGVSLQVNEAGAASGAGAKAAGKTATREMHAQTALASFVPSAADAKRMLLHTLHMTGAAQFAGQTPSTKPGSGVTLTRVQADDLTTTFAAEGARQVSPQRMVGRGHTELEQQAADRQVSTGDALEVNFAARLGGSGERATTTEVSSAVQTGHVVLHAWPEVKPGAAAREPSVGHAGQAVYTAAAGMLTLSGTPGTAAEVDDGTTDLRAAQIVLHQGTGDGEATGSVVATTTGSDNAPATHVLAARAALLKDADESIFFGTDREPAQLWQGGSQIQAARLTLDSKHHTLAARPELPHGVVNSVFAAASGTKATPAAAEGGTRKGTPVAAASGKAAGGREGFDLAGRVPEASRDAVQVRAAAMDYNDLQHEATFTGGVTMRGSEGDATADHGAAFLQPAETSDGSTPGSIRSFPAKGNAAAATPGMQSLGGRLQRLVLVGDVHLKQPGRVGTGTQMTYTAATSSFVLTGTPAAPPAIHDQQQGMVTGATLLFGAADSSIVVAGTRPTAKQSTGTRVHTETDLQKR